MERSARVAAFVLVLTLAPAFAAPEARFATPQPKTSDDPFTAWTMTVSRRLLVAAQRPAHPPPRGGRVVIRFTVDRGGKVIAQSIATSSGVALYDRAALGNLARAQPFPPIPEAAGRESAELEQAFRYEAPKARGSAKPHASAEPKAAR